jgi:hypothetical protein
VCTGHVRVEGVPDVDRPFGRDAQIGERPIEGCPVGFRRGVVARIDHRLEGPLQTEAVELWVLGIRPAIGNHAQPVVIGENVEGLPSTREEGHVAVIPGPLVSLRERPSYRRVVPSLRGDGGETGGPDLAGRVLIRRELLEAIVVLPDFEKGRDPLAGEGIREQFLAGTAVRTEGVVDVKQDGFDGLVHRSPIRERGTKAERQSGLPRGT